MNWISGFWRRIGALLVDLIILGIVGLGLGQIFERQFVELGGWGRIIGFLIALIYFGILNSKLFGGQTLGKRALELKVVNSDNQTIDVSRSFARFGILGIPFFLNGAHITNEAITSFWLYLLSFVVFGGLLSIAYLYIFNRETRQSLHDLIIGTYVVNANVEKQETDSVWRPHLIVVGALFISAATVPAFTSSFSQSEPLRDLLSAQAELMKIPSVNYATVSYRHVRRVSAKESTETRTYASVRAVLNQNLVADAELARHMAEILTSNYPGALQKDVIYINLTYGYDIGIASFWRNQAHTFSPQELANSEYPQSN